MNHFDEVFGCAATFEELRKLRESYEKAPRKHENVQESEDVKNLYLEINDMCIRIEVLF
jgi:hypothetical protein